MPPRKLSAEDKLSIVSLYRESGQTTSTVAEQYGVSVSTISRLLKSELPTDEYEALVKQKRGGSKDSSKKVQEKSKTSSKASVRSRRTVKKSATVKKSGTVKKKPTTVRKSKSASSEVEPEVISPDTEQEMLALESPLTEVAPATESAVEATTEADTVETNTVETAKEAPKTTRRRRRRSRVKPAETEVVQTVQLELTEPQASEPEEATPANWQESEAEDESQGSSIAADDLDPVLSVVEGDDFADDFDDDIDDEADTDDSDDALEAMPQTTSAASPSAISPSATSHLEILPIADADLERMLYLVIDRTADLITCPMQEFHDLGQVPSDEEKLATLPVFDNHRIARRFSKRNQRVIKVPDGRLLAKTAPWLQAKGITRCLLDGQVYSLESRT